MNNTPLTVEMLVQALCAIADGMRPSRSELRDTLYELAHEIEGVAYRNRLGEGCKTE